jgi:hypothetical protein
MEPPPFPSKPLPGKLLGTQGCLALGAQINEFENQTFGSDFYCSYETFRPWAESGCLFYSAVLGESAEGGHQILSVASVLLTNEASRNQLLRGEISDCDLVPWLRRPESSSPVAYFASVISAHPRHLPAMYEGLLNDVENYLGTSNLKLHSGFGIATTAASLRHLTKSGFLALTHKKYLQKYEIMVIDASTARPPFFHRLFRSVGAPRCAPPPSGGNPNEDSGQAQAA